MVENRVKKLTRDKKQTKPIFQWAEMWFPSLSLSVFSSNFFCPFLFPSEFVLMKTKLYFFGLLLQPLYFGLLLLQPTNDRLSGWLASKLNWKWKKKKKKVRIKIRKRRLKLVETFFGLFSLLLRVFGLFEGREGQVWFESRCYFPLSFILISFHFFFKLWHPSKQWHQLEN